MSTGQMVGQVNAAALISEVQGIADAEVAAAGASASSASASAAAALASEGAAALGAAEALAAQVAAESAADTAQNSSGTYASTAAGLAAVASGAYFYVPTSDGGLIRYLDNAGVAVEVGRVAAGAVVQELVASVPPRSTDAAGDLDVAVDAVGRVYRRTTSDGGLVLAGRSESVQTRLAELDALQVQEDTSGWQDFGVDAQGRVARALDAAGGLRLAGRAEAVQSSIAIVEAKLDTLYRPPGSVSIPASFTPFTTKALRGEERYIWAGMPAALRPNQDQVTVYPFEWASQDLVIPSMMRRRKGTIISNPNRADRVAWGAEEAITVNAPANFFDNPDTTLRRQFRDGAHMYDRKAGLYYYCDSAITDTASGWNARNIPIFSSADGLTWDFVAYTPDFLADPATCKLATPDWFIDADGQVYLVISGSKNYATIPRNTWILRCTNPDTMASWEEVGEITGTAIPVRTSLGLPETIDCYLMQRDGIYYFFWRAESAPDGAGSEDYGQIGLAWATSILGPYNDGHRFLAPSGEKIKGEGVCAIELPPGSPSRFRLFWDNFQAKTYAGITSPHMCCDTDDFVTFTAPRPSGFDTSAATIYERNTAFVIGY